MFGCTENWFSLIFFVDIELFEVLIRGQDIFFFYAVVFSVGGGFCDWVHGKFRWVFFFGLGGLYLGF